MGGRVLTVRSAADLAAGPVVPLGIRPTPRRDVSDQAHTVTGQAAPSSHARRLLVSSIFQGDYRSLRGAQADAVVGADLTLGPDIPLRKLFVRIPVGAVHHCKSRAFSTVGAAEMAGSAESLGVRHP